MIDVNSKITYLTHFFLLYSFYSSIKFLASVAIFCTYFIQIYVFFQIIEPIMLKRVPERHHTLSLVLLRVTTVCITCKYICILSEWSLVLNYISLQVNNEF